MCRFDPPHHLELPEKTRNFTVFLKDLLLKFPSPAGLYGNSFLGTRRHEAVTLAGRRWQQRQPLGGLARAAGNEDERVGTDLPVLGRFVSGSEREEGRKEEG